MKEQFASTAPAATTHPATGGGTKQFAGKEQAPKAFSCVGAFIKYLRVKLLPRTELDRKSTRLNSSHLGISYALFCLKKKNPQYRAKLSALLAFVGFNLTFCSHSV